MNTFRITRLDRPVRIYKQVDYRSEPYKQAEREHIARVEAEAEFRKPWTPPPSAPDDDSMEAEISSRRRNKRLRVRSEHGIHVGELIHDCSEMTWEIVSLPAGTSQDVVDRVAKAWQAIVDVELPKDYATLSDRCGVCQRQLTDQVSKTIGLGPDCAHRLGAPPSTEAANRVAKARQTLVSRFG